MACLEPGYAKCGLCRKTFVILNEGEAALASHANRWKHQAAAAAHKSALTFSLRQPACLLSAAKKMPISDAVSKHEALNCRGTVDI